MMNRVLKEVNSSINGKVVVMKTLGLGTYLQVDGLTQSGGVVSTVWKQTLRKVKRQKKDIQKVLILGLGGGSAVKLVKKYFPFAIITGVEIDPVMVDLGCEYLNLDRKEIKIIIDDAYKVVEKLEKRKRHFDLIIVDMYIGYEVPEKFEKTPFLKRIKKLLRKSGIVIFNRLYFAENRSKAIHFAEKLDKVYSSVDYIYPEANVMLVCKA